MPAWLASAFAMITRGSTVAKGLLTRRAAQLALTGGAAAGGVALADPAGGLLPGLSSLLGLEEEKPKRRRRRRALTASDRADIAFIAGALGPSAGKAFAVQLVAGLTR